MRWINGRTYRENTRWHRWFAWHPVQVGTIDVNGLERRVKVWLCVILRKYPTTLCATLKACADYKEIES